MLGFESATHKHIKALPHEGFETHYKQTSDVATAFNTYMWTIFTTIWVTYYKSIFPLVLFCFVLHLLLREISASLMPHYILQFIVHFDWWPFCFWAAVLFIKWPKIKQKNKKKTKNTLVTLIPPARDMVIWAFYTKKIKQDFKEIVSLLWPRPACSYQYHRVLMSFPPDSPTLVNHQYNYSYQLLSVKGR